MDYVTLREKPRQFLSLTSLHVAKFDDLLTDFAPAWEHYHRWRTLADKRRQFPAHQERPTAVLAGSDVKLFFPAYVLKKQQFAASSGRQLQHLANPRQPAGGRAATRAPAGAGQPRTAAGA